MIFELFARPLNFLWFLLVPVLIIFSIFIYYRKKRVILQYFSMRNFLENTGFDLKKNIMLRSIFITLCIIFVVIALARPQWGNKPVNIKREGVDIIVAVDISKSMNVEDIKPSRYFHVKQAVKKMMEKLSGDRVSLVFFGRDAFIMVPYTSDYYTVELALDNLNPNDFPMPGTNYANLFRKVDSMVERSNASTKFMLIFSDGEDLEKSSDSFLKLYGVKIYTVGVGTEKGDVVPEFDNKGNRTGVKKYRDEIIISKLESDMLKRIAKINSGKYMKLSYDLSEIDYIVNDINTLDKTVLNIEKKEKKIERFHYFLIIALLFFVLDTFFINYWPFKIKN